MSFVSPASSDNVRLTLNTVEKRITLAKQELTSRLGLKEGTVSSYDLATRSGQAIIDNKLHVFRAVDTTIAVGDKAVFQRLVNGPETHVLLGVIL